MVKIYLAHTTAINPPSSSPKLTHPQVWAALQRKIRYAHEFVPVIDSCTVLSDHDGILERKIIFKPGMGPGGGDTAWERVRCCGTAWVEFEQRDGSASVVRNIIARGGESGEDLFMTYAFEFEVPGG
ncbi:hypothetical protein ACEQ8H_001570 [Pleosporales sp. CAS-2024a]